jgi:hypothetical protein
MDQASDSAAESRKAKLDTAAAVPVVAVENMFGKSRNSSKLGVRFIQELDTGVDYKMSPYESRGEVYELDGRHQTS